jgi:hypothetical protein
MIPQSATNDEHGYREYNLGNNEGDNIEDEDIKAVKNRVTLGVYTKELEDKIKNKYGSKKI